MFLHFRIVGEEVCFDFGFPTKIKYKEPLDKIDFGLMELSSYLESITLPSKVKEEIDSYVRQIRYDVESTDYGYNSVDVKKFITHMEALRSTCGKVKLLLRNPERKDSYIIIHQFNFEQFSPSQLIDSINKAIEEFS